MSSSGTSLLQAVCVCLVTQSCLTLCDRQEHWSGLPFPSLGNPAHPGIEPGSPALQADSLPSEPQGSQLLFSRWCTQQFSQTCHHCGTDWAGLALWLPFSKALTRRGSFRHYSQHRHYRQNSNACAPLCSPSCLPSEVPHTGVLQTGPVGGASPGHRHTARAAGFSPACSFSHEFSPCQKRTWNLWAFQGSLLCTCFHIYLKYLKSLFTLKHFCGGGSVANSCPTLATPWTADCQAPLSMGFSRQEHWSGLPFPVFLRDIHKS